MPSFSLLRRSRSWSSTTVTPPQITTALAVAAHQSSGGHDFGLIHAQNSGHYTVLLSTTVELSAWAKVLAYDVLDAGAHATDVVAITAVTDTIPITESAYTTWAYVPDPDSDLPGPPHHVIADDEVAVRAHLAVTFAAATTDTRRFVEEMGVEVARRLPTLIASLAAAGIPTTPMTVAAITDLIAASYREDHHGRHDFADAAPGDGDPDVDRTRAMFCHDQSTSMAWTIAPHVCDPDTIATLLTPTAALPRRRTAMCWRTIRIAEDLPKKHPARVGFVPRLHRMGGVAVVTEPHGRIPDITPIRDALPAYARLGVRTGYDRHAELFALSVGMGVLLPEHGALTDEPHRHRHRTTAYPATTERTPS